MKKILYLLITILLSIVLIPTVFAANEVSIESIELVEHSDNTLELSKPKTNKLNISFDLSFIELEDYAKYKVIINNPTKQDYEVQKENTFKDSDHINYEFEFEEENNKVSANSKLTMFIKITYNKKLELTEYKNGIYEESNNMSISLLTKSTIVNPETKDILIKCLFLLFIVSIAIFITIKTNNKKFISAIIIGILIMPIIVCAVEALKVNITTKVTIEEKRHIIESRFLADDKPDFNSASYHYPQEKDFWQYCAYLNSITFFTSIEEPEEYKYKFDVSEKKDNSIIAYIVTDPETYQDNLYIMCDGYIYANPDSSFVFYHFYNLREINNIEYYKTPYAKDMSNMFNYLPMIEELHLDHFNTENVTDMSSMFEQDSAGSGRGTVLKTIDISSFDTSNVTTMKKMFYCCRALLEIDLSHFNTSSVTDMSYMFGGCNSLKNIDFSSFDTRKVTDMSKMFSGTSKVNNLDLSYFDTSSVTNMSSMFYGCSDLTKLDVSSFDTSNVTDMSSMFSSLDNITTLDLSNFDTSKVTTMRNMFGYNDKLETIDLSNFNTRSLVNMESMFAYSYGLKAIDLSNFNTSNVTTMKRLFADCSNLQSINLNGFDISKITSTNSMFYNCSSLVSIDLSSFNTSNVTNMYSMFDNCENLETIYVSNKWTVANVTSSHFMFRNCTKLPNFDSSYTTAARANTSSNGYLTLKV